MIKLTDVAVAKMKEFIAKENRLVENMGLRVSVLGGGCSGFSYHMATEDISDSKEHKGHADNIFDFDGLKVFVDQMSMMYLDGVTIDYRETLQGAGFSFENPNVKSQCGCGQSFSA